ncbi:unnamed protein product [Schistosoma turkestanicum]|nr:unnamed protein product [Schistosoma turkestanicum]
MITTNILEESLSFGPLPTSLMIAEPAYLIAQTTTDRLSELPTIYADPKRLSDPIRLIEWICNVRCARYPAEQNMELIYSNQLGQSFYRTTRRIEAGEELLIWFRRQDLQPLVMKYLNNLHISEAWIGQSLKSMDLLQKNYEECDQSLNTDNYKFKCSKCHEQFIYIYPYISHCLFKCCQKQTTIQHVQWINPPYSTIASSEFPIELTNKYTNQQNMNFSMFNNLNTSQFNQNQFENIENMMTLKNDVTQFTTENLSHQTDETRIQTLEKFQCKPNENNKTNELPSMKHFNEALQRKHLPKIHSNNNKISRNMKVLKHSTNTIHHHTDNNNNNNNNSLYKKSKTTLLPLKSRNPLVEQLLQTLLLQKTNPLDIDNKLTNTNANATTTTLSSKKSISPALISSSLSLAQNWCARCFVTFRLTSDLVHHMRTCHNQTGGKQWNCKDRSSSLHKPMSTNDLGEIKKNQLPNDNENDSDVVDHHIGGMLQSIDEQTCLSSSSSMIATVGISTTSSSTSSSSPQITTTTTTTTAMSGCSLLNKSICSLCGEQFKERHHLTRHMLSHT